MTSSFFSAMNSLRRALQWSGFSPSRSYASKRGGQQNTLYSRLSPLGNPNISLVPELDRWAEKGKRVSTAELNRIIRDLRTRRRYKQALEVSEWMGVQCSLRSSDHAVQLDLIGRVRGLDSAETYFNNLTEKDQDHKTYGALLNCYVREKLTERSLSHMEKMKMLGFASSALPYNDLMCLYATTGRYEKIPELLAEMKEKEVVPDTFSYRICINSYGERSDLEGMEKVLKEMESQPHIVMDWNTYSAVANVYIKAGLTEKALSALRKSEEKLDGQSKAEGYNFLITLYGSLGHKSEVDRLWKLRKECKKVINKDYISMLSALVKLEEFEEAQSLLKEWETSGSNFDFRVPNVLLIGYCQKDMLEKAETMLEEIMKKGRVPIPNSFGILAAAFEEKGDMGKAFDYMKKAISSFPGNEGWRPKPTVIKKILGWLGEEGKFEEVEGFVGLLSAVIPMDKHMYHTLIKASIREGKDYKEILESMEVNNIKPDQETEKILGSSHDLKVKEIRLRGVQTSNQAPMRNSRFSLNMSKDFFQQNTCCGARRVQWTSTESFLSSSPFSTMNYLRKTIQWSRFSAFRSYASKLRFENTLYNQQTPLGNPNTSLVPELDRRTEKGENVSTGELTWIIRDLRMRRRYQQALEISEWMGVKYSLKPSDHAVQLDLIGRVRGLESAEAYFNSLNNGDQNLKTYRALLHCYVREELTERALSLMQKMKELGFASSALPYNDLMSLYANKGQHEKIPELLAEMKENMVVPDTFSYRMCIKSYGERSDVEGVDKVLEEMKNDAHKLDWNTYADVANAYIKAGLIDKAVSALKKSEERLKGKSKAEGYSFLITLYVSLGYRSEVERLWVCRKACQKVINNDYISMLNSWSKLNKFEEAESLLKEWETSGNNFDFRVPNALLLGYCHKGRLDKAEAILENFIKRGKVPRPNSFGILAAAFEQKGDMGKAFEYMNKALSSYPGNEGWHPRSTLIEKLLQWLGKERKVEEVEDFIGLLSAVIPMDRDMYHTLIKASVREGKDYKGILESMEINNIMPDEETKKILGLSHDCPKLKPSGMAPDHGGEKPSSRKRRAGEDDDSSDYSDSRSESSTEESEDEMRRKRKERKRRRDREYEKEMRSKRREKERREEKRRKKEKERKKRKKEKKKEKEKAKMGAVTNSWGKYGIIRETDMWTKRPEFTAWLAEVKQVNLENLQNREEKQMFKEFMEDHNTATFPSKKYYDLDTYQRRKMEREMKKGLKRLSETERTVFNDEELRRQELLREREKQKEQEVKALKQSMQSGLAQAMKEQAQLREEMAYQYRIGNFEAAAAIQRRLDPDVAQKKLSGAWEDGAEYWSDGELDESGG
ncbi:hypothetical protein H6P81_016902 [Aristolochia fimbriata]|uniref:Pentatricopeptide repeat-containing protein n=2 Tax=Magnoliopsida TaxID=3398 RepID=A0AAV7E0V2_ARIFI|nr:hypothetical protein H6P81_016902 [Aristolochia fimbriata]